MTLLHLWVWMKFSSLEADVVQQQGSLHYLLRPPLNFRYVLIINICLLANLYLSN